MEKGEGEHEEGEQIEAIKAMEGDNCDLGGVTAKPGGWEFVWKLNITNSIKPQIFSNRKYLTWNCCQT